eukprot:420139-Hanusia_phi.AAC.1
MPSDHDRTRINMIISDHGRRASDPRRSDSGSGPAPAGPAGPADPIIGSAGSITVTVLSTTTTVLYGSRLDSADPARTGGASGN